MLLSRARADAAVVLRMPGAESQREDASPRHSELGDVHSPTRSGSYPQPGDRACTAGTHLWCY